MNNQLNKSGKRFTDADVITWREQGGVLIERFFNADEVAAVRQDFETVFSRQNQSQNGEQKGNPDKGEQSLDAGKAKFDPSQFATFEAIPFDCSPALNLIGVHPSLLQLAKVLLDSTEIYLYQCQAWAKYTGDADYNQPFHCDFLNHTLTVPGEDATKNCVTILCYFTDVSETHGPMHYVSRPNSDALGGPDAFLERTPGLQKALAKHEQSSAAPAGSIFPYSIDIVHRGTNLTEPDGVRYAVMACFKSAGNDAIGYHAWPFHHTQPWSNIFDHASPEQLACFGVQKPGDPHWTPKTLTRAQLRYPNWDLKPYWDALDGVR